MKSTITNVHVSNLSHDNTRAALGWERGGFRYHIWFNIPHHKATGAVYGDGIVYKNPIVAISERRDPTVRMKATSGPNEKMLIEAWGIVHRDDLIGAAIAKSEAEERERLRKAASEAEEARKRFYGPELYEALCSVRGHLGNSHPHNDTPAARAALTKIVDDALALAEKGEGYAYAVG